MKRELSEAAKRAIAMIDSLGLTVEARFVPWSQSRNKDQKERSLNWKVTVKRDGRKVLTTDYSAGIAHCPGYDQSKSYGRLSMYDAERYSAVITFETEQGFPAFYGENIGRVFGKNKNPIVPSAADVLYSLVSDSDVLNYSTFEDWARELGYSTDSRSAEKTYRACLEIALAMRNGVGEDGLTKLQEAFQDY